MCVRLRDVVRDISLLIVIQKWTSCTSTHVDVHVSGYLQRCLCVLLKPTLLRVQSLCVGSGQLVTFLEVVALHRVALPCDITGPFDE